VASANACVEKMNGYTFDGRPCALIFVPPHAAAGAAVWVLRAPGEPLPAQPGDGQGRGGQGGAFPPGRGMGGPGGPQGEGIPKVPGGGEGPWGRWQRGRGFGAGGAGEGAGRHGGRGGQSRERRARGYGGGAGWGLPCLQGPMGWVLCLVQTWGRTWQPVGGAGGNMGFAGGAPMGGPMGGGPGVGMGVTFDMRGRGAGPGGPGFMGAPAGGFGPGEARALGRWGEGQGFRTWGAAYRGWLPM